MTLTRADAQQTTNLPVLVSNVATIRAMSTSGYLANSMIQTIGYWSPNDGGGGEYTYNTTDTTSGAVVNGYISNNVMNVVSVISGSLAVGQYIYTPGINMGVYITANTSGGSGVGLYTISSNNTIGSNASPVIITADNGGTVIVDQLQRRWQLVLTNRYVNIKQFGAIGNDIADDSVAIYNALNSYIKLYNSGYIANVGPTWGGVQTSYALFAPPGIYHINNTLGQMPGFPRGLPGQVEGSGSRQTIFHLDIGYTGDLFSWSESWIINSNPKIDPSGPRAEKFTITGNTSASNTQTGLHFYDRNDFVYVSDVIGNSLFGPIIAIGDCLYSPHAYMRESQFYDVHAWNCGTPTLPAIKISSYIQANTGSDDGTNDLEFYDTNIFASNSIGLLVNNPTGNCSTRAIWFNFLRVESSGKDQVVIGSPTDYGITATVSIDNLSTAGTTGNANTILFAGTAANGLNYNMSVKNWLNPTGSLVNIQNCMNCEIETGAGGVNTIIGPNSQQIKLTSQTPWTANVNWSNTSPSFGYGLSVKTPIYVAGSSSSANKIGFVAMQGSGSNTNPIRLTTDGLPANNQNVFTPGYSTVYNLSIQVTAQDTTSWSNTYIYNIPAAFFSTLYGPGAATYIGGPATILTRGTAGANANVVISADTTYGGLNITFTPPANTSLQWQCSAKIDYVKTP